MMTDEEKNNPELDDQTLQKIKGIPILEVADELGLGYTKKGTCAMACCVVHADKHPSMSLSPSRNRWKCFSCNKCGSVIDLVMAHEHLDFLEACSWLMDRFHIVPSQKKQRENLFNALKDILMSTKNDKYLDDKLIVELGSSDNDFTRALVQCRILTMEQMKHASQVFRLGTVQQDRVVFWYIDQQERLREGKIMAYQADAHRSKTVTPVMQSYLLKKAGTLPDSWSASWCLFGLHQLAVKGNEESIVAIVESEKTAVICSELLPTLENTPVCWMACGGKGFLNVELLRPLIGRRVIVFPDTDPTGTAYADWLEICQKAARQHGQPFTLSNLLELHATPDQKRRKIDLADFLLEAADEMD